MINEEQVNDHQPTLSPSIEENESNESFGKFESRGESLLTLVKPELSSLAEYWLAALRDHALLLLPPGK